MECGDRWTGLEDIFQGVWCDVFVDAGEREGGEIGEWGSSSECPERVDVPARMNGQ